MTMSDRTKLIARLEKATGPDRELDRQIYCLRRPGHIPPMRMLVTDDDVPRFTSSLDAAMTLVPEVGEPTWTVKLALDQQTQTTREYFAEMQIGPIGHGREYFKSPRMKTPALALCIVALKAQETQSNG